MFYIMLIGYIVSTNSFWSPASQISTTFAPDTHLATVSFKIATNRQKRWLVNQQMEMRKLKHKQTNNNFKQ